MSNFIVTVVLVAIGVYFVANAYYLNHHVLFLGWVEQKWGPGSGTLAYKFIGLGLIVLATLIITGVINVFEDPLQRISTEQGGSASQTTRPGTSTPSQVNINF
ncbi:MAG: hypothetical protein OHK0017_00530 [Patescibacteria group bacterium]